MSRFAPSPRRFPVPRLARSVAAAALLLPLWTLSCAGGFSNQNPDQAQYHLFVDDFDERTDLSGRGFVGNLGAEIATELAENSLIYVERGSPPEDGETGLGLPVFSLTGLVSWRGSTATVEARLAEGPAGGGFWSRRFRERQRNRTPFEMQREMARQIARAVEEQLQGRIF